MERRHLERVLALHAKGYRLLGWIDRSLKEGRRLFGTVHSAMSELGAAMSWVQEHVAQFPEDVRPAKEDLDEFVHLLVSYLKTSFRPADRLFVTDGCPCSCCSHLVSVRHPRA